MTIPTTPREAVARIRTLLAEYEHVESISAPVRLDDLRAILALLNPQEGAEDPYTEAEREHDAAMAEASERGHFPEPSPIPAHAGLVETPWPSGAFSVMDPDPTDDHGPIYLTCPGGLMVNFSNDPTPGLDAKRVQWVADVLNLALSITPSEGGTPDDR